MMPMISCSRGDGGSKQVTISISPKNEIILIGDELQYTAVVTGLSDQRVSWSATGGKGNRVDHYLEVHTSGMSQNMLLLRR